MSKLSTGVIRGSEEGEFSKKLVGFAVYGTQIVDCKDDKPSRLHVRVKVPGIKSMLFSSAMGRRDTHRKSQDAQKTKLSFFFSLFKLI